MGASHFSSSCAIMTRVIFCLLRAGGGGHAWRVGVAMVVLGDDGLMMMMKD